MAQTDFQYYGLRLTHESREKLLDMLPPLHAFKNNLTGNSSSSIHLDHVTLLFHSQLKEDGGPELKELLDGYLQKGKTSFRITITDIGWEDNVIAFRVELPTGIRSMNSTPHLTMATYDYERPVAANKITHWLPIDVIMVDTVLTVKKSYPKKDA